MRAFVMLAANLLGERIGFAMGPIGRPKSTRLAADHPRYAVWLASFRARDRHGGHRLGARRLARKTLDVSPTALATLVSPAGSMVSPPIRISFARTPNGTTPRPGSILNELPRSRTQARPEPPISMPPNSSRLVRDRLFSVRRARFLISSKNRVAGADKYFPLRSTRP